MRRTHPHLKTIRDLFVKNIQQVTAGNGLYVARDVDFTDHCARAWLASHRVIVSAMSTLPPERGLRIRAEDVLDGSTAGLRSAAAWLGLRSDDAAVDAMRHPERSRFARDA